VKARLAGARLERYCSGLWTATLPLRRISQQASWGHHFFTGSAPPSPDHRVALRPGARVTCSLAGGLCGVRRAPSSPPWTFSHAGYVEDGDRVTVVNPSAVALYFLPRVKEVPPCLPAACA
jgi:hypothetical protein